jgi:hypothetical protein
MANAANVSVINIQEHFASGVSSEEITKRAAHNFIREKTMAKT